MKLVAPDYEIWHDASGIFALKYQGKLFYTSPTPIDGWEGGTILPQRDLDQHVYRLLVDMQILNGDAPELEKLMEEFHYF